MATNEQSEHQKQHQNHEVKVFIDRKEYVSPQKTTGAALYILGQVKSGYDLWEEEEGPVDDKFIADNNAEIHLHNFTHFYSAQRELNPGSMEVE